MLYCKLVRDKIPEIIKKSGKDAVTCILPDKEYAIFLERKLDEEIREYHESKDIEELADILEIIISLAKIQGYKFSDLYDIRTQKSEEKGGFSNKIFLISVSEGK